MRHLVRESFRYANSQPARNVAVLVVLRGTNTAIPVYASIAGGVPIVDPATDALGQISFYVEPGSYDLVAMGVRTPFDIKQLVYVDPPSITGLPDGTLIARTN